MQKHGLRVSELIEIATRPPKRQVQYRGNTSRAGISVFSDTLLVCLIKISLGLSVHNKRNLFVPRAAGQTADAGEGPGCGLSPLG